MFRIPASARKFGNDVMTAGSAATSVITYGATSLANLAQLGSEYSESYLNVSREDIIMAEDNRRMEMINKHGIRRADEEKMIRDRKEKDVQWASDFEAHRTHLLNLVSKTRLHIAAE